MKDKVKKIREEVARIQLYTQSEVLKQVLDYIDKVQEEPVSMWHDVSEEPKSNMELICVGKYGNPLVLSSNSDSFKSRDISKWAYFNDLLNLSNAQRTTKDCKEPVSEPNKELAETYLAVFDKKFPVLPSLKGKQLADYKDFLNKCQQIFGLKEWGIRPIQSKLFEKLTLLWAAWGAEHLQGVGRQDEKEQDIPVSEDLEKAAVEAFKQIVDSDKNNFLEIFKAGANWQKEKDSTVSEDLEKIVEEIAEPTILNAYGTKELARRLRNTICGTSVSEELKEASKEWISPQLDKSYANYGEAKMMELTHFDGYAMLDAIEFGVNWQKEQMMKDAVNGLVYAQRTNGEVMFRSNYVKKEGFEFGDKVKVIVIKED